MAREFLQTQCPGSATKHSSKTTHVPKRCAERLWCHHNEHGVLLSSPFLLGTSSQAIEILVITEEKLVKQVFKLSIRQKNVSPSSLLPPCRHPLLVLHHNCHLATLTPTISSLPLHMLYFRPFLLHTQSSNSNTKKRNPCPIARRP